MAGKRDKPEEIVTKLRQVEVLQGQGMAVADAVRQIGKSFWSAPTEWSDVKVSAWWASGPPV